jgi:transcriptional regulator PpsR
VWDRKFGEIVYSFQAPHTSIGPLEAGLAARIVSAAADVALVVDGAGIIKDLAMNQDAGPADAAAGWVGQPWVETVTVESRSKVEQILLEAGSEITVRPREVNQRIGQGDDLPVRYSAVKLGSDGDIIVVGRELRTLSRLQQRLIDTQRSLERDYARLRHAETRYRQLFFLSHEAMLITDAGGRRVTDVNPAATQLLGVSAGMVVGQTLASLFADSEAQTLQELLLAIRVSGRTEGRRMRLPLDERVCVVSASSFRIDNTAHVLLRLTTPGEAPAPSQPVLEAERITEIMRAMPDAFLVTDPDFRVLEANGAFLDLVELTAPEQARGAHVDRWFGRPTIDTSIMLSNLREHGFVRDFATVLRGEYGARQEVEITAVSALASGAPCIGLVLRRARQRQQDAARDVVDLPRSVEQLTELVGRVSLKEIVRETTDVIERLCIEAALKLTGDNRASAAQMLGLSRQSLYGKLRRFGVGDLDGDLEN